MIRVVVADDHNLVRKGILSILDRDKEILVVGEAADGREAVELAQSICPDVLIMDIAMPLLNGIEALEQIRSLGIPSAVLILTMYSDQALVRKALRSGAKGYVLKTAVADELIQATKAVYRGEVYLSPPLQGAILAEFLTPSGKDYDSEYQRLTRRERQVLQLIAAGHSNPSIADILGVKARTVQKHRSNLMAKLGKHDVVGLVSGALSGRLISEDPVIASPPVTAEE